MTSQLFCVNSMYSIIVSESSVTGVIANHLHIGELKSRASDTHLRSYRQPVVKLRSEFISSSAVMFWPHVLLTPWKSLLVIVVKPESRLIFQINVVVIILHSSKADCPWRAGIYVSFVMLNEAMHPPETMMVSEVWGSCGHEGHTALGGLNCHSDIWARAATIGRVWVYSLRMLQGARSDLRCVNTSYEGLRIKT